MSDSVAHACRVSKACSALTLKICAISRNIGIVMISPMLLGEVLPMSQFGWYMFSTTGEKYQLILVYANG